MPYVRTRAWPYHCAEANHPPSIVLMSVRVCGCPPPAHPHRSTRRDAYPDDAKKLQFLENDDDGRSKKEASIEDRRR